MENKVLELDKSQYHETEPVPMRDLSVIAAEINAIKAHTCSIVCHSVFEIGKRLCEAKASVDHGSWGAWLMEHVSYSESTAQNLMRLYREMGEQPEGLSGANVTDVFEGLNYSQMVALFPLPKENRAEFVRQNAIAEKSAREIKELVEREKRALEEAKTARESAAQAQQTANEAMTAKKMIESQLNRAGTDKSRMATEINDLKQKNEDLSGQIDTLRKQMNKMKIPEEKEVPPSEETLSGIREDIAKEYAVRADPDVQGITYNLGDLSERVGKIDQQLSTIRARDPELAEMLSQKVTAAMRQILGAVAWNPWSDDTEDRKGESA